MAELFTWVPFFEEMADRLRAWRDRQRELIHLLDELRKSGYLVPELTDIDSSNNRFGLREIDPFTTFALFNRGITDANRLALCAALGRELGVKTAPPNDMAGVPVVHNQRTWFFCYARERQQGDIPTLWSVFEAALHANALDNAGFRAAFDAALRVKGVRFNLTMGLFWIRPQVFVSLDGTLQAHAGLKISAQQLNSDIYLRAIRNLQNRDKPFYQLSYEAWLQKRLPETAQDELVDEVADETAADPGHVPTFWLVGAYWDREDQTDRFISHGVWENGYEDVYIDEVKSMRPGERIAIKAAHTRKHGLPFETNGKAVSVMSIKAIGTIVENLGDGRHAKVAWDRRFQPKDWYFYTNRQTVWGVQRGKKPYNDYLIDFAFYGRAQDHSWFLQQPYWAQRLAATATSGLVEEEPEEKIEEETAGPGAAPLQRYGIDDILAEGAFLPRAELDRMVRLLRAKKNLILQGPPGVGKTFLAKRIAYAMIGARDAPRVSRVQFHQSMSYEDFVRGLRPVPGKAGFELVDGPFLEVTEAARVSADERDFVLIIEEINRGNPSQIFGELLTLLEADKREPEYAIRLTYPRPGEPPFYVPANVYVIGTMNLADRSLALVDHALRRRFAFETLTPQFGDGFVTWCEAQGLPREFAKGIASRAEAVNSMIADDRNLGENYLVGHSYFCPRRSDLEGGGERWYRETVLTQVVPLLSEYWFDDRDMVERATRRLLDGAA